MTAPLDQTEPELAVSYGRFSGDLQDSTREQHGTNRRTARNISLRWGGPPVRVVVEFSDESESRDLRERPGLTDTLGYIRTAPPEVRHLIIPQWNRMFADPVAHETITETCARRDIRIWDENGEKKYRGNAARLERLRESNDSLGQVYGIRDTSRSRMMAQNEMGDMTSRVPYGLRYAAGPALDEMTPKQLAKYRGGRRVSSRTVEADPETLPVFVRILEWVAEGVTLHRIVERLQAEGIPSPTGNPVWNPSSVQRMVRNEGYLGKFVWGRREIIHTPERKAFAVKRPAGDPDIIHHDLPPFVDPDLWARANRAMSSQRGSHTTRKKYEPRLLSQLVRCRRCGGRLYQRPNSRDRLKWRFYCAIKPAGGGRLVEGKYRSYCTTWNAINEEDLLRMLTAAITGHRVPSGAVSVVRAAPASLDEEVARCETAIANVERGWEEAQVCQAQGTYGATEMAKARRRYEEAMSVLEPAKARAIEAREYSQRQGPGATAETLRVVAQVVEELLLDTRDIRDRQADLAQFIKAIWVEDDLIWIEAQP